MPYMPSKPALATFQPEDDVDKLFNQLFQIEPPDELIPRVLSRVRSLSGPLASPQQARQGTPAQDALVVHNEKRDPS